MSTKRSTITIMILTSVALLIWPLTTSAQGRWSLLTPPVLTSTAQGTSVQTPDVRAPLSRWATLSVHADQAACEVQKRAELDTARAAFWTATAHYGERHHETIAAGDRFLTFLAAQCAAPDALRLNTAGRS